MTESLEAKKLLEQLQSGKKKLAAMLAPSFVIDFSYPEIVGQLKRAGFRYVVEVAVGAHETNRQLLQELSRNPKARVIASSCSSIVRYLRSRHPELLVFLSQADTPMIATAKIIQKEYPDAQLVFIGPCLIKKLEAQEHPDLNILVVTFQEMALILKGLGVDERPNDKQARFDLARTEARLYPLPGGLLQTSGIEKILSRDEYREASGLKAVKQALAEFSKNKQIKLLDILFCDGGCIAGKGIISSADLTEKKQKVVGYWQKTTESGRSGGI